MQLQQYTPKLLLQLNIGCVALHIAEQRAANDTAVSKGGAQDHCHGLSVL